MHTIVFKHVPSAPPPWFDGECRKSRRHCQIKERKYRKYGSNDSNKSWINALNVKNKLFTDKKNSYWNGLIKNNQGDPKKL